MNLRRRAPPTIPRAEHCARVYSPEPPSPGAPGPCFRTWESTNLNQPTIPSAECPEGLRAYRAWLRPGRKDQEKKIGASASCCVVNPTSPETPANPLISPARKLRPFCRSFSPSGAQSRWKGVRPKKSSTCRTDPASLISRPRAQYEESTTLAATAQKRVKMQQNLPLQKPLTC